MQTIVERRKRVQMEIFENGKFLHFSEADLKDKRIHHYLFIFLSFIDTNKNFRFVFFASPRNLNGIVH